ncbi:E3 ubiquitin-protein ligase march5 [Chamberlinius hualienensis]
MAASSIEAQDRRYCWVCFATDEDDREAAWVKPCRCSGTTKWVHQNCLQRWIDEKQKGNAATKVACPQCNTEYIILFPRLGTVVYIMDVADSIVYRVSPFIVAGILVGSIYWTAVTYGAVTVMQVLGHKEGLSVMEQADPLFLLVGLPTIPILLILSRMVHWEDYVLRLWRRHSVNIPIVKYLIGGHRSSATPEHLPVELPPFSDPVSATRVLCGALMMPTIATICGKIFFDHASSNLQKTILGGITFIAVKGILKIYYKHQQHVRQSQREILDFDSETSTSSNSR